MSARFHSDDADTGDDEKPGEALRRRGERVHAMAGQRLDDALRWLAADPRGRLFLWELMARTNWLTARFAADPYQTAWNDGRAETGNHLFALIERACPERFALMQAEARARIDGDRHYLKGDEDDRTD